jgi:cysteinyl-tRNA synthetase
MVMRILHVPLAAVVITACNSTDDGDAINTDRNYKQDMRDFVIGISRKAKSEREAFAIIPQNGIELVTTTGDEDGAPDTAYLAAIDGNGQEDLFFGYDNDNQATPVDATAYLKTFLNISRTAGKTILVTDYCSSAQNINASRIANQNAGYISYAATARALNVIPASAPINENNAAVTGLNQVKNFLYLIDPDGLSTKQQFINAVCATNYDAVIMDLFLEDQMYTETEINQLKNKANGGKRMVISYMSIGEAEDYRYYWNASWNSSKPLWMAAENPDWPGNYKVQYWNNDWQGIIYANNDSYLDKILEAGFDGVYLDVIDGFEYFKNQ